MSAPKPINLPVALVIEKGRKAYLAGKLSAQGPTPSCSYEDFSGRPCIIGAALSKRQRTQDRMYGGVGGLAQGGVITTDDLSALIELQQAHDNWACDADDNAEADLRQLLGIDQ